MRSLVFLLFLLSLLACSERQVEEFTFRKTLEYDLVKLCEDDQECAAAVKAQIKGCMEISEWRNFLSNQNDEIELKRFTTEFYACIVDSEGSPYFETNL